MEFADPVVAQEELPKKPEDAPTDVQTEEKVQKLESEIDRAYTLVESKFQDLWASASKNTTDLQEKYKLDEVKQSLLTQLNSAKESLSANNTLNVSENLASIEEQLKKVKLPEVKVDLKNLQSQANSALDTLDSKLEIVEQQAGKIASSFASFFTNIIAVAPETPETNEKETLFSSPGINNHENYGNSRYENDLYKLHTTESYYVSPDLDDKDGEKYDADTQTKEIAELLEKYPTTLTKLMNEIVPVKVSYNLFWYRYFKNSDKLKESEKKRKELLMRKENSQNTNNGDDEEEFTWDDDEEEEEAVDVAAEEKAKDAKASSKTTKDEDEDKDGDWE
ncbi:uncharacterized protein RJT20DRAFT_51963 [Scheffersomyces xylosifermentans]|uniref:uncharacterized protein n=1 Tax=Scheffersomyces xylosifermentans TaxID=1304137 RepID=UPI00315C9B12